MTDYGVTHGRAVGIGMAVIFRGCVRAGLCDPQALPEAFGRCRTERTFFEKLRDLIQLGLNP